MNLALGITMALTAAKGYTLSVYAKRVGSTQPSIGVMCLDACDLFLNRKKGRKHRPFVSFILICKNNL